MKLKSLSCFRLTHSSKYMILRRYVILTAVERGEDVGERMSEGLTLGEEVVVR